MEFQHYRGSFKSSNLVADNFSINMDLMLGATRFYGYQRVKERYTADSKQTSALYLRRHKPRLQWY